MSGLVEKTENPSKKETMKRCCKRVDISNRDLISKAVYDCLEGKQDRNDTLRMFKNYSGVPFDLLKQIARDEQYELFNGIVETVIDGVRQEIIFQNYQFKPIWYTWKREGQKLRRIGIQDIKQQLYDYIAVYALDELLSAKIGYYQCAAIPNKGQVFGMRAVKRWVDNPNMRYAWKGDAHHYYEKIDKEKLKKLLKRYVKNKSLLKLVFTLMDSFEVGLSIGSYLSQYLANFYMSFSYHFASQELYKERKRKDGTVKRERLIAHVLIYMDDVLFVGSSKKDMKMAVKRFRMWTKENFDIEIKEEDEWIDLRSGYIDMMGFLISREKVIVRHRIFRRHRKSIQKARSRGKITIKQARSILSRNGWCTNAQCKHFYKTSKAIRIINTCKEMEKNGKNVIYFAAAESKGDDLTVRKA